MWLCVSECVFMWTCFSVYEHVPVYVCDSPTITPCQPGMEMMAGGSLHLPTCWYYLFGFPGLAGDMELNTDTLVPKQNSGNIWSPGSLNSQPIKLGTGTALFSFLHRTEVEESGALVVLIEELTRSQRIENCWNPKQKGDRKMWCEGECVWEREADLPTSVLGMGRGF